MIRHRNQIHRPEYFDGFQSDYPSNPELRVQFHAPVHFQAIRGLYAFTYQLEAPAIYWGRDGRCFAFLHDLTPEALTKVMADCRAATFQRRGPFGDPFRGR